MPAITGFDANWIWEKELERARVMNSRINQIRELEGIPNPNNANASSNTSSNTWGASSGGGDNSQYSWQNAREAASQAHGYAMDLARFNLDSQKGLMDKGAALRLAEMTHGSSLNKDEAQQGSNLRIRESDNSYTWQQALQKQNEQFKMDYLDDEQQHDETMFRKQEDAARRSTASDRMAARRIFRGM